MPIHDWTRVDSGIFHGFHTAWVTHLSEALNNGRLPPGFYAYPEQHAGRYIADMLTLHTGSPINGGGVAPSGDPGGVAVAVAPPFVQRKLIAPPAQKAIRRTLTVRHVSGHRIVALLEIASPRNKDRAESVNDFAAKVEDALRLGVHVVVIDLFPPGLYDPRGLHGAIWQLFDPSDASAPPDDSLTLASYVAAPKLEAHLHYPAVGDKLPEMPLYLHPERYVGLPLEETYQTAFRGMPAVYRAALE